MAAAAGIVGGLIGAGGSIIGGIQQNKGLDRARNTAERQQLRQLEFAREQLDLFQPFLRGAEIGQNFLLRGLNRPIGADPAFQEARRETLGALSASGNLRSGFAQDAFARLALDAADRRFGRASQVLGTSGRLAAGGIQNAGNLFQQGLAISNDIASIQATQGGVGAGTIGSVANTIGGAIGGLPFQIASLNALNNLGNLRPSGEKTGSTAPGLRPANTSIGQLQRRFQ